MSDAASGRDYAALRSECESAPWPMHAGPHARTYMRSDPNVDCAVRHCIPQASKDDPAKPWQRLSLPATVRATAAVLGKELSFLGRAGQPECQSLVVDVACAMAGEHDVVECREAGSVPLVLHVL
jgi:hypothetical protein